MRRLSTLPPIAFAIVIATLFSSLANVACGQEARSPTVGMEGRIVQLVLPGSELIATPLEDDRTPIVLRIVAVFKHGTDHRYDFVFHGLEPGKFDLRDYLQRKDGSPAGDLPPIPIEIQGLLGPGQVKPNSLTLSEPPAMGGYQTLLFAGGVVWLAVLLALLFFGRKKKHESDGDGADRERSLADRLRPLVEQARKGELTKNQQAQLERLLLGFWRMRLDLKGREMASAIATLRQHHEAGALLRELEKWLHSPGGGEGVDVAELLKPYENVDVNETRL